jgi:hypothetical protein
MQLHNTLKILSNLAMNLIKMNLDLSFTITLLNYYKIANKIKNYLQNQEETSESLKVTKIVKCVEALQIYKASYKIVVPNSNITRIT